MNFKKSSILALATFMAIGLTACDRQGPAERAGENIDNSAEKMGDKIEDATDNASDKVESAGDKIENETDK